MGLELERQWCRARARKRPALHEMGYRSRYLRQLAIRVRCRSVRGVGWLDISHFFRILSRGSQKYLVLEEQMKRPDIANL